MNEEKLCLGSYLRYLMNLDKISLKNLVSPKPLSGLCSGDMEEKFSSTIREISS